MKKPKRRKRRGPNLPTIADEWAGFVEHVLKPAGLTSKTQHDEMQKAFYGGARIMMCMMQRIGQPDIPTIHAEQYLEARDAELEEFSAQQLREYGNRDGRN